MSQYDNDFESNMYEPFDPQGPKRSWFGRNWFWLVPLLVLTPINCCCGGIGSMFWWVTSELKQMPPYIDSVAMAQQDAAVQQALGAPIEVPTILGFPNGGDFDFGMEATGQTFEATLVLNGSSASGTLRIEAQSSDGVNWTYTVRQVELADGTVIDLIPAGGSNALPAGESAEPETPETPETETPSE